MSAMRRLATWLGEPGPGTVEGRRLAAARARLAATRALQAAARAAAEDARRRAELDLFRHETCQRVQASGRCVPPGAGMARPVTLGVVREQASPPPAPTREARWEQPVVPDVVPRYLVEIVEHEGRSA